MSEALVFGAPWDGISTVGGCVRDACGHEEHMSLALRSECRFGAIVLGSRPGRVTATTGYNHHQLMTNN